VITSSIVAEATLNPTSARWKATRCRSR
jgi:hypothetical protein